MTKLRNERIRKTLMKEIAEILQREIRDPRISGVVSIVDVEMSQDNSYAKVIYSVFSTDNEAKERTINALNELKPQIRFELGKRIRLRHTPDLRFIASDTLEKGSEVTDLINKISRGEI